MRRGKCSLPSHMTGFGPLAAWQMQSSLLALRSGTVELKGSNSNTTNGLGRVSCLAFSVCIDNSLPATAPQRLCL
jgi:hypothetical protein